MRRIGLLVFAMVLGIVVYAQKQIVILHTNDTHSQIVPVPKYENEGNISCRCQHVPDSV